MEKYAVDDLDGELESEHSQVEEEKADDGQLLLQDRIFSFVDSYRLR
jgi:hypothetical protein